MKASEELALYRKAVSQISKTINDLFWARNDVLIKKLPFSTRVRNSLERGCCDGKVIWLSQLLELSERDLLRFKNMGKKSVKEIKIVLEEMGIKLGDPLPCRAKQLKLFINK